MWPLFVIVEKPEERMLSEALLGKDSSIFDLFETPALKDGELWNFRRTENARLFDKLKKNSILLGDITTIVQSMQTGLNEVLAPPMKIVKEYSLEEDLIYPIAKSGSILRYEFEPLDRVIIWTQDVDINKYPNTKKYLLPFKDNLAARYDIKSRRANWWEISNPRSAKLFLSDRPRILVPFIATGNKFCVDDKGRLNDGGDIRAIFFEKDTKYSKFYICAILNSKLCQYYHLKNTKLKRDGYYEYFEGQLSILPIRRIDFAIQQEHHSHYLKEAKGHYQQYIADSNPYILFDFVNHYLSQQPEASEVVHDLLAYLAERMHELNKEKRDLQKTFLGYLETMLEIQPQPDKKSGKAGIEALKGKDRLLNYPRDYQKGEEALLFQEVENILLENRQRFRKYLDNKLLREIEREYVDNIGIIEKLKQQLWLTDNLIDEVVYVLYGLTEEEKRVVRGEV